MDKREACKIYAGVGKVQSLNMSDEHLVFHTRSLAICNVVEDPQIFDLLFYRGFGFGIWQAV